MGTYNVHAGHNPAGKIACGAVGLINESIEDRKVCKEVVRLLKLNGHTVYDCTVDNGTGKSDVLAKIVKKCNAHKVDYDVSIHFNSGANDKKGNGKTTGTEVFIRSGKNRALVSVADRVCNQIVKTGQKDRGLKYSDDLYVLKHTNAPAMLVECCFVDDKDDVKAYSYKTMAQAIVKGLLGKDSIKTDAEPTPVPKPIPKTPAPVKSTYYKKYSGKSEIIDDVLKAVGVPEKYRGNYKKRLPIAKANGIKDYGGTASQNLKIINLAEKGKLKKP